MRIISESLLRQFANVHRDAGSSLEAWIKIVRTASWRHLAQVRQDISHADETRDTGSGKPVTVFNIAGNKYRLVTAIHYNRQLIYTLRIMTHAEYSKEKWKDPL